MIATPPRERPWVSWLVFVLCTLAIFATIPFARAIRNVVIERWGRLTFAYVVVGCVVISAIVFARRLRRAGGLTPIRAVWLLVVTAAYLTGTGLLAQESPEEAIHFLEYGLLSILAFRALSHKTRDASIYLAAALLCAAAGTVDEFIQWLTPRRVWEIRDVGINAASAAMMQVGIAFGVRPPYIAGPIRRASVARLYRLALAQVALAAVCFLNTPPRVAWIAARVPSLRPLLLQAGSMTEYGTRIEDPEIGVFYSRLSVQRLKMVDAERGVEAARILDAYQGEERYPEFLRVYPSVVDPFLHEARVHLFRRDRFRKREDEFPDDPERRRFFRTVAFRENRIIEKYFPTTLAASGYILEEAERRRLEADMDRSLDYSSAVSKHLIVRYREWQILSALGLVAGGLVLAAHRAGKGEPTSNGPGAPARRPPR